MKRFVVLCFILGAMLPAGAVMVLSDIEGISYTVENNTVTIYGTNVTGYSFNLMPLNSYNGDDILSDTIPAGFSIANHGVPYGSYGFLGVGASVGAGDPVTGVIYSFEFAPGIWDVQFIYSSLAGNSQINIGGTAVNIDEYRLFPEPASILLLCIGSAMIGFGRKK